MEIILALILFLLGIIIGSFLNVVADRIPAGKSIVTPPSHCFHCNHRLETRDLVPVISYLLLKGKCRYCGNIIPPRSLIVELFTGLVFIAAYFFIGLNLSLLEALIYISIFIILIITDMESDILPQRIVYPSLVLALLISAAHSILGLKPDISSSILGFAIAIGLLLIVWGILKIFKRNMVGFAEVGMAGLVGASVGFPLVAIALCLAILTGGITALILLVPIIRNTSHKLSFGIFLAIGAISVILWGKELLHIYSFIVAV